jgi:hypothetical protein
VWTNLYGSEGEFLGKGEAFVYISKSL